ncbi:RNA-binding protein 48 isoform X1 [Tanacetum coccineum]
MARDKDAPPAVRVYTVCDESKYLIVRNVPALGCGDELRNLFEGYGQIDEFVPLDDEECEPYTDVYWIKFHQVNNARFAKRKLDESVFIGNRLQVSYAPQYESLDDTKEKLEGRRKEVLARLNPRKSSADSSSHSTSLATPSQMNIISQSSNIQQRDPREPFLHSIQSQNFPTRVSSNQVSTFILLRLLSIRALGGVKLETYELNVKLRLPPDPRVCGLYIYSSLLIIASLGDYLFFLK